MKKIVSVLFALQLVLFLTGCCCPCAKKAQEQKPQETQPQEQPPSN